MRESRAWFQLHSGLTAELIWSSFQATEDTTSPYVTERCKARAANGHQAATGQGDLCDADVQTGRDFGACWVIAYHV